MTNLDGLGCGGIVTDFREAETAGLARETVPHDGNGIYGNSMIGKELLHIRFIRCIRKIPYEKFLHFTLLLVTGGCSREAPGGTER